MPINIGALQRQGGKIDTSFSLESLKTFVASLPSHPADKLKECLEMKCGLPTLRRFKEEWSETELRDALEHWLEYLPLRRLHRSHDHRPPSTRPRL